MERLRDALEYAVTFEAEDGDVDPIARPAYSILLVGPRGVGKTHALGTIADDLDVRCLTFTATDVFAAFRPEDPRSAFHPLILEAARWPRAIAVLDHLDVLLPSGDVGKDYDLAKQLVELLQNLAVGRFPSVVFVATTTHAEGLDATVRAKFEEEILLTAPTFDERLVAMRSVIENHSECFTLTDGDLRGINDLCGGATAPQVLALLRDTVARGFGLLESAMSGGTDQAVKPIHLQLLAASRRIALPTATSVEVPHVAFADIVGLEEAKSKLLEAVVWPSQYREAFAAMGLQPAAGLLLYGVPGTGKTMLAKAVATELHANFLPVHITSLIHGEVGESERALAEVFRLARTHTPCVVFLDELQAMFTSRDSDHAQDSRLVSQLFLEMDLAAAAPGVTVLGATNCPDRLDPALLAPGRMDTHLHILPPSREDRATLLTSLLRDRLLQPSDSPLWEEVPHVAAAAELLTGADLATLCNAAALNAYHRQTDGDGDVKALSILPIDLRTALEGVTPAATPAMLQELLQWRPGAGAPD